MSPAYRVALSEGGIIDREGNKELCMRTAWMALIGALSLAPATGFAAPPDSAGTTNGGAGTTHSAPPAARTNSGVSQNGSGSSPGMTLGSGGLDSRTKPTGAANNTGDQANV